MKKTKKLTLRRETIQVLETDTMAIAAGGQIDTWTRPSPTSDCPPPTLTPICTSWPPLP